MPTMPTYDHDPDSTLDYGFDWSPFLSSGEELVSSVWVVTPTGPTLSGDTFDANGRASVFVTGGTVDVTYELRNRITTNSSPVARIADRTLRLVGKHL